MSNSMALAAIVFVVVLIALMLLEYYSARRRERRIVSETATSVQEARERSEERLLETRKRNDAYQERAFKLQEENNALLREVLKELRNKNP